MNDNHDHAHDEVRAAAFRLWNRYAAGESLGPAEQEQLRAALRDDLAFRDAVLEERWIDQLLRFEAESTATEGAFVARVLERCQTAATTTSSTVDQDREVVHETNVAAPVIRVAQDRDRRGGAHGTGRNTRGRRRTAWLSVAATAICVISAAGLIWRYGSRGSTVEPHVANSNTQTPPQNNTGGPGDAPHPVPRESSIPLNSVRPAYATVTGSKQVPGETHAAIGTPIGSELLKLNSGELQLTTATGVVVDVFGPSQFKMLNENSLALLDGELSATVPGPAQGFQVTTPSVVVVDLGTVFDVAVHDAGTTEVEVRRGSITVASREQPTQQQWHLNADDVYQLTFYSMPTQPNVPDVYPVASLARDHSGQRTGAISLGGRTMKFDDEIVFAAVRDRVRRGVQEAPEQFTSIWSQFVESTTQRPEPAGAIVVNGVEFEFHNLSEAIRTQHRLRNQLTSAADEPQENATAEEPRTPGETPRTVLQGRPAFQGTLIINGQQRTFESLEQYNAALRELLGPAAEFGVSLF